MGTDAFTVLAAAAQVTQRLRLGTGIVPLYTRPLVALELIQLPVATLFAEDVLTSPLLPGFSCPVTRLFT